MNLEIKRNEILAKHCSFRIGGPAKFFVAVKSREQLRETLNFVKEKNLAFFVLGGGSNVLFKDEGYNGLIIKILNTKCQIKGSKIVIGAGKVFSQLIKQSIKEGLIGLEWGTGIPGTVGGAIACNCGAYGHSFSEFVISVSTIDKEGNIKKYLNKDCGFDYRSSRFKRNQTQEIIWEAELKLKKGNQEESEKIAKEILARRQERIPSLPSAGSIFKNIVIDKLENREKISAGYLIEQCGLKGKQIGGAQISEKHANFIVNLGQAKAKEVKELMNLIKERVKEKFGLDLEKEIVLVPRGGIEPPTPSSSGKRSTTELPRQGIYLFQRKSDLNF